MTIIIGVDPGVAGAVAMVDDTGPHGALVFDLPVHTLKTTTGKTRNELDPAGLTQYLGDLHADIDHVFLEQANPRPGEGIVSMYRYGYACGLLHGVFSALGYPVSFVRPQAWQKQQSIGPGADAARQRVAQLYPSLVREVSLKKHQHRADAVLIARYGLAQLPAILKSRDAA